MRHTQNVPQENNVTRGSKFEKLSSGQIVFD